ncbi:hypothetical protein NG895_16530 [Aeoliella sp. ICT_H6.2]|uniref:Uncharacterized protein n=1 Tax=Aeoliella straminimaris TaxID=2954799 RepID=A0A9X2FBL4_9BACT|nr:hypothetical protein [Aeoliella straminimaris]MCO6045519.1 hypothetical protein [Aeoliella straminimaris]
MFAEDVSDQSMKSAEQILAEANKTIAHMHNRPTMYISSASRANAGDIFDGMLWIAHWFWATIQSREGEFRRVLDSVRESHQCSSYGFPDGYRRDHPNSDDESAFHHVKKCWEEVDAELGIDISEEAADS